MKINDETTEATIFKIFGDNLELNQIKNKILGSEENMISGGIKNITSPQKNTEEDSKNEAFIEIICLKENLEQALLLFKEFEN